MIEKIDKSSDEDKSENNKFSLSDKALNYIYDSPIENQFQSSSKTPPKVYQRPSLSSKRLSAYESTKKLYLNKKLPFSGRVNLSLRMSIICLLLILISLQTTIYDKLRDMEKNILFIKLQNLVSFITLKSDNFLKVFHFFQFLNNKVFMGGIICILYSIFHPFIALKLIFGLSISNYVLIIIKMYYKSERPSWLEWNEGGSSIEDEIIECDANYSNPSTRIFNFVYFIFYTLFAYKNFYYRPKTYLNNSLKVVMFLVAISFLIVECVFLLLYKLQYLNEIVYTIGLSLAYVCLLIDFDHKYQIGFFRATKNLFKIRKNIIKCFLFCFFLLFLGFSFYNFCTAKTSLYTVVPKIYKSASCSREQKDEISMKNTFFEISYIFTMLGSFWGASLSLQICPSAWWYQSPFLIEEIYENLSSAEIFIFLLKGIIVGGVYFLIWFGFYSIPYLTYEFNFVVKCFEYFIIYFICMGVLPYVFSILKMNDNKQNQVNYLMLKQKDDKIESKQLFESSLFAECFGKKTLNLIPKELSYFEDEGPNNELTDNEEEQ